MTRRRLLQFLALGSAVPALAIDASLEVRDLLARLASAMSEDDSYLFLKQFNSEMQGYGELARNVRALLDQNEVSCSIVVLEEDAGSEAKQVKLDWLMNIHNKADAGSTMRRHATLTCRLEWNKDKYRIAACDQPAFFAPPDWTRPGEK